MSIKLAFIFLLLAPCIGMAASPLTIAATEADQLPFLSGGTLTRLGTEISAYVRVPVAGTYQISARFGGRPKDGVWPHFGIMLDGTALGHGVVADDVAGASFQAQLTPGTWSIGVQLLNESDGLFDSIALYVQSISIEAVAGDAAVTRSDHDTWLTDAQARDAAVLAASEASIAKLRQGEATLEIVDGHGEPLPGVMVAAEQRTHAFLFGCNIAGLDQFHDAAKDAAYASRFEALFNYATVPLYWRYLEPVKGSPDWGRVDAMVRWCTDRGMVMKGHPLLWDSEHGVPTWASVPVEAATQRQHVEELLDRYADRIRYWEVVNEPANHPGVLLSPAQQWARDKAPDAVLVVNEYGPFYNGHPEFLAMLSAAKKADVPFDAVGIQGHAPPDMAFPLARVQRVLDAYAALGKRIHITELTPPSQGGTISGAVWRGTWSEATQADYAEDLYRVLFAHPAVDAISWWDLSDQGAWVPNGGLLRADASPKPAYERLHKLIQETWHTRVSGASDAEGRYTLHGFYGTYRITVTRDGKPLSQELALKPGQDAPLRVVIE